MVDADRLVGGVEGQGLVQAQQVFGYTRLMVAAFGLGAGWAALDRAIPYSAERIQAGGPLSEKQGYTHKLIVPHAIRLEAARAYIEETAEHIDGDDGLFNTEGAIAKYMATEAGNAARRRGDPGTRRLRLRPRVHGREDQARRAHHDDLRRHVGDHGDDHRPRPLAAASQDRPAATTTTRPRRSRLCTGPIPTVGADVAALAHHALAEVMEACRAARLTRNQHVLLRLGEWVAWTECSAAPVATCGSRCRRRRLPDKGDHRFDAAALAAMSRVFAREAAMKVTTEGLRWLHGGSADVEPGLDERVGLTQVMAAQSGLIDDMDAVAAAVYGRDVMSDTRSYRSRSSASAQSFPTPPTPLHVLEQPRSRVATRSARCKRIGGTPTCTSTPTTRRPGKTYSKIGGWVRDWDWAAAASGTSPSRPRSATPWTTPRSGPWPAPMPRSSTTAGPSAPSTRSTRR